MVRVYRQPFDLQVERLCLFVDEVASISKAAVPFFRESMASLRFVRSIMLHVNPEVMGAMSELALAAVGAVAAVHVVFAEGTLSLGWPGSAGGGQGGEREGIMAKLHFFSFCGGFGFDIEGGRLWEIEDWERFVHGQVYNTINDYSPIYDL